MKRYIALAMGVGVLAVTGCQPQPTPEDRLDEYVGHWNEQEFTAMYEDYLTQGSKEAFPRKRSMHGSNN